jgi:3-isopropylmalate/(R)-2-methylmalate dehydratase small subunit
MDKFTTVTGVAAPLDLVNVDTDMIIPKQFLKTIARTGLGKNLFDEMRFDRQGRENPDFVLNQPAYRNAEVLISGENFGWSSPPASPTSSSTTARRTAFWRSRCLRTSSMC